MAFWSLRYEDRRYLDQQLLIAYNEAVVYGDAATAENMAL
jgi:hypothetical protein